MRKVYIHTEGGRIFSENCFSAALGFAKLGYHVVQSESDDKLIINLLEEPSSMFVGGIRAVQKVFKSLDIPQPKIDNPHIHLPQYMGRDVHEITWNDVEQYSNDLKLEGFPFFIKPMEEQKLFTGLVIKSEYDLSQIRFSVKPETKILMSECVNFISEYRCFVLNKEMVGCKNYKGDFKIFPNASIMENAINDYINQPVAYSIDFGVTDKGETLLIEMNDAFGLGSYGLDKLIYCKILEARWDEILGK